MTTPKTAQRSLIVLLFLAMFLLAVVVQPIASALFLAAVLAGLLWPLQQRFAARLNASRGLAAGLIVVMTMTLVAVPLGALTVAIVKEGAGAAAFISKTFQQSGVEGLIRRLPAPLRRVALDGLQRLPRENAEQLDETVQRSLNGQGGTAMAVVGSAISTTGSLAFQTILMAIALYFLLVQGDQLVEWIDENAPLERGQARELLVEFQRVSSAVVTSSLITAGAQALAALVGYLIVGVPQALFATGVTFMFAFIPGIGAGFVCLAVAGLVALSGQMYPALFLAVWALLVVGLADNVVRPLLIKGGTGMHGAILFFALVGGLKTFGALGLLVGPLSVALFLAILRLQRRKAGLVMPGSEEAASEPERTVEAPQGGIITSEARS